MGSHPPFPGSNVPPKLSAAPKLGDTARKASSNGGGAAAGVPNTNRTPVTPGSRKTVVPGGKGRATPKQVVKRAGGGRFVGVMDGWKLPAWSDVWQGNRRWWVVGVGAVLVAVIVTVVMLLVGSKEPAHDAAWTEHRAGNTKVADAFKQQPPLEPLQKVEFVIWESAYVEETKTGTHVQLFGKVTDKKQRESVETTLTSWMLNLSAATETEGDTGAFMYEEGKLGADRVIVDMQLKKAD